MSFFSKNIYLSNNESIPVDRAEWQKKEFQQEKCQHKGRSYQIHQVIERPLNCSERAKAGLKALIAVVATLGIALLFSSTVRELCSKAIKGSETETYWKPVPKSTPKPNSASKPSSLNFDRITFEEGFSLTRLSSEENEVLSILVNSWKTRDSSKEGWTVSELAALLKQEETALQKLLDLVFFIPDSQKNYSNFGLEKLFKALESSLSGEQQLSCQPGVKVLWNGRIPAAAAIFGKGNDNEYWKVEELGRFLAVRQDALINFLGGKKDRYSYQEIDLALNTAQNSQINGILEKNRTQNGSIRWKMIA